MKPSPRDLMVARAVRAAGAKQWREYGSWWPVDLDRIIESIPEPAEPVGDESGCCQQHGVYACRKCWTARPAEHGQAVQDTDDEDWLDKLVRENGGEVEFFTRAQVDAARREGMIAGLEWARHRASTVSDVERIQAEIARLIREQGAVEVGP